jgi:DNA-binding CsgD family transcriptional regulator
MTGAFVGRAAELDTLRSELDLARARTARLVLVEGAAGIGKTALVRRFLAASADTRVLRAEGDEAESQLPFGVLERLLGDLDVPLSRQLAAIVHGDAPVMSATSAGTALLGLLGELQDGRPVVLVVDDAHWADGPSLAAITFALRRLKADQVLSIVCARETAIAIPDGMRRLVDEEGGTWLRLTGLSTPDLQALAIAATGEPLSAGAARRLREHTLGSPLYAAALLGELGPRAFAAAGPLPAPSSFAVLVQGRLASCSPPAEALAVAASVLGQRSAFATAARLAGDVVGTDPVAALDETVAAGLLRAEDDDTGSVVAFPHPLIRAAVYAEVRPARRAGLHARAADLLDGDAALAHRIAAAGPEDPELARVVVAAAGPAAARGAWGEAAANLLAAARLDPMERELLVLHAAKIMLIGLDVAGVAALRDEIASYPPTADRDYVLGHLAILSGRPAVGRGLLEGAFAACDPERDPEVAAMIAAQLGFLAMNDNRGQDGVRWGRAALESSVPGSPLAQLALTALQGALATTGRAREALSLSPDDAAGREARTGSGPPALAFGRGLVRLWIDDLTGAMRDLAPVLDIVRSGNLAPTTFQALVYLSETEFRLGAWDDAVVHADLAASLAADTGAVYALPFAHAMAGYVHGLRGRWDLAEPAVAAALGTARGLGLPSGLGYAHLADAYLASARGDATAVLAAVAPMAEMGHVSGISEPGVIPWRDLQIDALVRLGRSDEAEVVLSAFEAVAADRELGSGMASAARVRGCLEAARGDRAAAVAAFERGVARAEPLGMPFLQAQVDLEFGAFLRRFRSRRSAVERLQAARDRMAALGADPFVARCDRELVACGLHPAPRGEHHVRLTPQELAVSHLLAQGMSNREIAGELVVSVKTVEYHLGNIYSKMGISSRGQLVARMARTAEASGQA